MMNTKKSREIEYFDVLDILGQTKRELSNTIVELNILDSVILENYGLIISKIPKKFRKSKVVVLNVKDCKIALPYDFGEVIKVAGSPLDTFTVTSTVALPLSAKEIKCGTEGIIYTDSCGDMYKYKIINKKRVLTKTPGFTLLNPKVVVTHNFDYSIEDSKSTLEVGFNEGKVILEYLLEESKDLMLPDYEFVRTWVKDLFRCKIFQYAVYNGSYNKYINLYQLSNSEYFASNKNALERLAHLNKQEFKTLNSKLNKSFRKFVNN